MCLGACLWSRLEKVYYGNTPADAAAAGFDDAEFYDILKSDERQQKVCEFLPIPEDSDKKIAQAAFKQWVDKEDKVPY